jgi:hypothetical protein
MYVHVSVQSLGKCIYIYVRRSKPWIIDQEAFTNARKGGYIHKYLYILRSEFIYVYEYIYIHIYIHTYIYR